MSDSDALVVVGASIAGVNAVDAARRAGWLGRVVVVDRQACAPYDRPPLSKRLFDDAWDPAVLSLRDERHWESADVELLLATEVTGLRPDEDVLDTSRGPIDFVGLVIATGCDARTLPLLGEDERISTLRTLADAERIRSKLRAGARLAIVGGGFIGLELAAAATSSGVEAHVIEIEDVPLARVVGIPVAELVLGEHRRRGVALHAGRRVMRAEHGDPIRLTLDNDRVLEVDVIVVGIGVVPATSWLERGGVDLGNGVVCDQYCATSRPRVYAAGDNAEWWNPAYDTRMRVEHWTTAREQGAAAGRNLVLDLHGSAAAREPFHHVPYVWSDQFDLKIQILGRVSPDQPVTVEAREERRFIATYGLPEAPDGAVCVNAPKEAARLRRVLSGAV